MIDDPSFFGPVLLGALLFLGFFVQAAVGFGSTLVIVTLGAHFFPIVTLLPVLAPLDIVMPWWVMSQDRAYINRNVLLQRILPFMGLGLLIGFWFVPFGEHKGLRTAFAAFVTGLAMLEIYRTLRRNPPPPKPMPQWQGIAWLLAGGLIHGIFTTGGPLIVAYASKALPDKRTFRATLATLWSIMSLVLTIRYTLSGHLTLETLKTCAWGMPCVMLGTYLGGKLHHRLDPQRFRLLVYCLLLVAGSTLLLRR